MADQNINNMSVTWNSGGTTFDAVKMNVTDTASAAASLLQNFQVGGVAKFTVGKDGVVSSAGAIKPTVNDGAALGASGTAWADLFLASGGVINFNAGDVTITHSANLLAFGADGLTYASLFFVVSSIVTYTAGVMIASLGRTDLRSAALGLTRVPALWAVVGALALRELHATLPAPAAHAVSLLAQACIPTFLVILGIQLRGANLRGPLRPMLLASGLRLAGGAAAGLVLAPALGLTGAARQAAVLQSAMPTAVITTIIAIEYDVEPALVASVVLLTTLLSPFTLTPLLAALQ